MTNREIDALVASAIGWAFVPPYRCLSGAMDCLAEGRIVCTICKLSADNYAAAQTPRYSTDPSASGKLLDRMVFLGFDYGVGTCKSRTMVEAWFARRDTPMAAERIIEHANRLMAVALASLAALGVEVK